MNGITEMKNHVPDRAWGVGKASRWRHSAWKLKIRIQNNSSGLKYLQLEVIDVEAMHESIRNLNIIEQWKEAEI